MPDVSLTGDEDVPSRVGSLALRARPLLLFGAAALALVVLLQVDTAGADNCDLWRGLCAEEHGDFCGGDGAGTGCFHACCHEEQRCCTASDSGHLVGATCCLNDENFSASCIPGGGTVTCKETCNRPCGSVCCFASLDEVCVDGRCCPSAKVCGAGTSTASCCLPPNVCSTAGECCQGAPCGDQCCDTGECCGNNCCIRGGCCGDECCPSGVCCGTENCCAEGEVCTSSSNEDSPSGPLGGVCCSPEKVCGALCCGADQRCATHKVKHKKKQFCKKMKRKKKTK